MQQMSMHRQVLANMDELLQALDSQKHKLTMENMTFKTLISRHVLNAMHPKAGRQSNTPDQEVLKDIVSNNQSAYLEGAMSNPEIENRAMNFINFAERFLTKGVQRDPVVPSPNLDGLFMRGPSPEDVPIPTGNLSTRHFLRKEQNESATSMQAQGGLASAWTLVGGLSAPIGLCQEQSVTQVTPVHFTSQVTESQALPSVPLQPSQPRPTSGLPGSLQSAVWPSVPQQLNKVPLHAWPTVTSWGSQHMDAELLNSASTTASTPSPWQFHSDIDEPVAGDSMVASTMFVSTMFGKGQCHSGP